MTTYEEFIRHSKFKTYQFLNMFGGFDRAQVLGVLVQLAENQYDTITNLEQMTLQEIMDIHKVIISREQEKALAQRKSRDSRIGQTVQDWK